MHVAYAQHAHYSIACHVADVWYGAPKQAKNQAGERDGTCPWYKDGRKLQTGTVQSGKP